MALDATAKLSNIKKSIYSYFGDLLAAQGLTVDDEGLMQNLSSSDEWIQMTLLNVEGGEPAGQADSSRFGLWRRGLLNFNIFIKLATLPPTGATTTYRATDIRDIILGQGELGTDITLKDYSSTGAPAVDVIRIMAINTDRRIPNNQGFYQYNLTLQLLWLEKV